MKKVVSATLAGALAVGMVPAMALADDAIELQAETEAHAIANGSVILADGQKAGQEFEVGSLKPYLMPTGVQIAGGIVKPVESLWIFDVVDSGTPTSFYKTYTDDGNNTNDVKYQMTKSTKYNVDSLGVWTVDGVAGLDIENLAPGNYAVGIKADGQLVLNAVPFKVVAKSLDGATFYEPVATGTETFADKTFVFNGENWEAGSELQLVLGGKAVASTDYAPDAYYNAANVKLTGGKLPQAAGKYSVDIVGAAGKDYENSKENVAFEIKAVDLKDITFTLTPQVGDAIAEPAIASYTIDGVTYGNTGALYDCFDLSFDKPVNAAGAYTATISLDAVEVASNGWTGSITGTTSVNFTLGAKEVDLSAARYNANDYFTASDDTSLPNAVTADLQVNRAAETYAEFDPAKVTLPKVNNAAAIYTLEYQKDNGKNQWVAASLADLTDASAYGTFRVRAVLDAAAYDYKFYGATDWMEVATTNGTIVDAGVTFVYDDGVSKSVVTSVPGAVYDGTDVMDDIAITVKAGDKVLAASDYTVKIVKSAVGATPAKEVAEIVDAGTYTISITSSKYQLASTQELVVTVSPLTVDLVMADQIDCDDIDVKPYCALGATHKDKVVFATGKVIDPVAGFTTGSGATLKSVAVPADAYKVTIKSFVPEGKTTAINATEIKEAGLYTLEFKDTDTDDVKNNYTFTENGATLYLHVTTTDVFADVAADDWYADAVYDAVELGYMTGYQGDKLGTFGPMNAVLRGEAATVLSRMANVTGAVNAINPFSDINTAIPAFYNNAVIWCNAVGIMTGYTGTDEFGPKDALTREQMATVLMRYEKLYGDYKAADPSVLAAYADGDEVSPFAKEAMAWAVENGIFGVNTDELDPQGEMLRCHMAAVTTRFQPEGPLPATV